LAPSDFVNSDEFAPGWCSEATRRSTRPPPSRWQPRRAKLHGHRVPAHRARGSRAPYNRAATSGPRHSGGWFSLNFSWGAPTSRPLPVASH